MRGAGGNAHLAPSPGGGPERLVVLMEAEALLNDASAITLFEVFMHIIEQHISPAMPYPSVWSVLPTIITQTLKCAHGACSCGETGQRPFFPPVGRAQGFGGPALPSRAGKHALSIQPPPPTHPRRAPQAGGHRVWHRVGHVLVHLPLPALATLAGGQALRGEQRHHRCGLSVLLRRQRSRQGNRRVLVVLIPGGVASRGEGTRRFT